MYLYRDLAYLLLLHPQDFHGVFNMYIAVPSSGSGCAFEDPADLELLAVHGAVLIRRNDNDHIPDLDLHAPRKELRDNDLPFLNHLFALNDS